MWDYKRSPDNLTEVWYHPNFVRSKPEGLGQMILKWSFEGLGKSNESISKSKRKVTPPQAPPLDYPNPPTVSSQTTERAGPLRPFNKFNIFCVIERYLLLQQLGMTLSDTTAELGSRKVLYIKNYIRGVTLPPRPRRFQHVSLPLGWFVPGVKRIRHCRSNLSFEELARMLAVHWTNVDEETLLWCNEAERVCIIYYSNYLATT